MGFESPLLERLQVREHSRLPSQQLSHISSGESGCWFPHAHTLPQISLSTRLILILGIFRVTYPEITLILVPSSVLLRSFARGGKVARPGRTGLLTTQTNQRRCRPVLMGTCAVSRLPHPLVLLRHTVFINAPNKTKSNLPDSIPDNT